MQTRRFPALARLSGLEISMEVFTRKLHATYELYNSRKKRVQWFHHEIRKKVYREPDWMRAQKTKKLPTEIALRAGEQLRNLKK